MTNDEKQLLSRCFEGYKASWDHFVQRYAGLIYHTIKRTFALHGSSTHEHSADDLFQDIFLSLVKDDFSQFRRFRGDNGCTLASWLRMIAARRTIDHLRKSNNPADPPKFGRLTAPVINRTTNERMNKFNSSAAP